MCLQSATDLHWVVNVFIEVAGGAVCMEWTHDYEFNITI